MTQIILPDTPSAVLQLLNADKQALERFATAIIQDVKQGNSNPLEIQILIKKYEYVLDQIRENIKVNVNTETAKYGEKPFEYGGAECHYTPTRTEYDFSVCGDRQWQYFSDLVHRYTEQRKEREMFLKTLKEAVTIVDNDGEVMTISPPQKKQSYGLKVSLK